MIKAPFIDKNPFSDRSEKGLGNIMIFCPYKPSRGFHLRILHSLRFFFLFFSTQRFQPLKDTLIPESSYS